MEVICTRPSCIQPRNFLNDLDSEAKILAMEQRYCASCGMPLLLADRYLPSKPLKQGGFSAAFLACDRYKPKFPLCVVKQFKPADDLDVSERALAQELFQREALALEELGKKHPQIPHLYAFFTPIVSNSQGTAEEQYFYLAQEFIDGQDLAQELATKNQFSEADVTEVLVEILKILEFVHNNDLIHRDLKPSNIMRDHDGVLYLLDFGAVKQIAAGGSNQQKSTGIYSLGFAPPEQISGEQVDPATDIYALAVTCLNLLTGKPPEELYDSLNNSWQWHQFVPNISDRLKQVLDKMLLPTPAQGFQSASSVLDALIPQPNQPITNIAQTSNPKPVRKKRKKRPFSLMEVLSNAAFVGFEGSLISMGIVNWLSLSGKSLGIIGAVMGGIVFALYRRAIKKVDLVIFALITAGVVAFIPKFQGSFPPPDVLIIAMISSVGAIAITALFRLVSQLIARFLY